jgi:hypothetical protein
MAMDANSISIVKGTKEANLDHRRMDRWNLKQDFALFLFAIFQGFDRFCDFLLRYALPQFFHPAHHLGKSNALGRTDPL